MTAAQAETVAAYRLTATKCCVCRRALVDAASVQRGLGPECARKYGVPDTLSNAEREEANALVGELALHASGLRQADVPSTLCRLHALGCWRLAERCGQELAEVTVSERGPALVVRTPYCREARAEWARLDGHRWDRDLNADVVVSTARLGVWRILRRHHAGAFGLGPKGPFVVQPIEKKEG